MVGFRRFLSALTARLSSRGPTWSTSSSLTGMLGNMGAGVKERRVSGVLRIAVVFRAAGTSWVQIISSIPDTPLDVE